MIIDIYNHFLPKNLLDRLPDLIPGHVVLKAFPRLRTLWDLDTRLKLLDQFGDLGLESALEADERMALIALILVSLVALQEGSTRFPVTGPRSHAPMRRVLKAVTLGREPGDITTIEDEGSVEEARVAWSQMTADIAEQRR